MIKRGTNRFWCTRTNVQHRHRREWFSIDDRPRSQVTRSGVHHRELSATTAGPVETMFHLVSSGLLSRFNFYVATFIVNQFNFTVNWFISEVKRHFCFVFQFNFVSQECTYCSILMSLFVEISIFLRILKNKIYNLIAFSTCWFTCDFWAARMLVM